jgi:hypothetical protein
MASLAEIRARLQSQDTRNSSGNMDRSIYPHWNIQEGESCLLRFLPDGNDKNTFFWVERAMIRLPFSGVKGDVTKQVNVQVPCVEMWGDTCPVLTEVRSWFKDPGLEEMGRKYWKKRSYLMQGFVRENPMEKDETPENPIRRFIMTPQMFSLIKGALMDPELEEMPTDYNRGLDFRITKTAKGGYADYSTSKWARKESALTQLEREAVAKFGLFNLNDFMPKRPTAAELTAIKEMFEASVDGQPYDPDRWGQYYKPAGFNNNSNASDEEDAPRKTQVTVPAAVTKPVAEDDAPFDTDPTPAPAVPAPSSPAKSQKAEDILAMIRNRQKKDN